MEIVGTLILIGMRVGFRLRTGGSATSSDVRTGTDDERGGPKPVRMAAAAMKDFISKYFQ